MNSIKTTFKYNIKQFLSLRIRIFKGSPIEIENCTCATLYVRGKQSQDCNIQNVDAFLSGKEKIQ